MKKVKIISLVCVIAMLLSTVNVFAFSNNVNYDGSNAVDITGGTAITMTAIGGIYGKAEGDMVYEHRGRVTNYSKNIIDMWVNTKTENYVVQSQLCITDDTISLQYLPQIYYGTASAYTTDRILTIENGELKIPADTGLLISADMKGHTITTLEKGRWYNVDVDFTRGNTFVTIYVNGEPTVVDLVDSTGALTVNGLRGFRVAGDITGVSTIYMDNLSCSVSTNYNPANRKAPALSCADATKATVAGNEITLNSALTVADLKDALSPDCAIRVYEDNTYAVLLDDSASLTEDYVLVAENAGGALSYYTVKGFVSLINNTAINTGTEANEIIQGSSAEENFLYSTFTPNVPGVGGKAADDVVANLTIRAGTSGRNYLSYSESLFEFSILTPSSVPATNFFGVNLLYYCTDALSTNERASLNDVVYVYKDSITVNGGAYTINIEPDTWHSIALVAPEAGNTNFKVYVDGVKYDITLAEPYYATARWTAYKTGSASTVYLDNIRTSSSVNYHAEKDVIPTVGTDADDITIDGNTIAYASSDISDTATKLAGKLNISETASVRVYENSNYTTLLEDADKIADGNVVVVADTYGYATERAYAYYTVSVPAPVISDPEVKVTVVNGSATVSVDGGEATEAASVTTYPVGTNLVYTAIADSDDMDFLYWKDADTNAVLTVEKTLSVVASSDAEYVAVFADKAAGEIYVTFRANNKVLVSALKEDVQVPANPFIAGYTFDGWYVKGVKTQATTDVSETTVYIAGFKLDSTQYTVTATGADIAGGSYKYNDKVTVTAAGEDGKVFTCWTRDGIIVSYSETYSFYVSGNTEVVANYADEASQGGIVLVMAAPVVVDTNKIGFYAERNVPEGYTLIETGILMDRSENFDINTADIRAKAKSKDNIGQFTARKANVSAGDTWYAKAYLIYSDGTDTYTVYSNLVSKTL